MSPPGDTSPRCSGLTSFDAVAGVVDRYGAADLTTLTAQALPTAIADSHAPDLREAQLIGAPVAEAPELARAASPVTYVHPGAPPFHIAHATPTASCPSGKAARLIRELPGHLGLAHGFAVGGGEGEFEAQGGSGQSSSANTASPPSLAPETQPRRSPTAN